MANILLLEPSYTTKYPPIGLMKIAAYYKYYRGDFVWFSKGELPEIIPAVVVQKMKLSQYYQNTYGDKLDQYIDQAQQVISAQAWDRVGVTTLFTYEWDKTVKTIEYAKHLVDSDVNKVQIGGVLATLMSEEIEQATGIKPITGLLTDSKTIGFDDGINIDRLTPDYSILDMTDYYYPRSDSYILAATRGCGMKCSFCAVKTLEPEYCDYIDIKKLVREINEKYGTRRNLILMDNNVLRSRSFETIIEDIKALGFGKNDSRINPKTGKPVRGYCDFNSGLDMSFLTERKAELLSEIAIEPVRIAFDHINDAEKYEWAIRLVEQHGIRHMSNYMLYNLENIKGKGHAKQADTPYGLYERIRINVALQSEFNAKRKKEGKPPVDMYCYPMKFVPLNNKNRVFYGTHWTKKLMTGLRTITFFSKGVIYSREAFFHTYFGKSYEEFRRLLLMPTAYIKHRDKYNAPCWKKLRNEWTRRYNALSEKQRKEFELLIADNIYSAEKYITLRDKQLRKLYAHYPFSTAFLKLVKEVKKLKPVLFSELKNYVTRQRPEIMMVNTEKLSSLIQADQYLNELNQLLRRNPQARNVQTALDFNMETL